MHHVALGSGYAYGNNFFELCYSPHPFITHISYRLTFNYVLSDFSFVFEKNAPLVCMVGLNYKSHPVISHEFKDPYG